MGWPDSAIVDLFESKQYQTRGKCRVPRRNMVSMQSIKWAWHVFSRWWTAVGSRSGGELVDHLPTATSGSSDCASAAGDRGLCYVGLWVLSIVLFRCLDRSHFLAGCNWMAPLDMYIHQHAVTRKKHISTGKTTIHHWTMTILGTQRCPRQLKKTQLCMFWKRPSPLGGLSTHPWLLRGWWHHKFSIICCPWAIASHLLGSLYFIIVGNHWPSFEL